VHAVKRNGNEWRAECNCVMSYARQRAPGCVCGHACDVGILTLCELWCQSAGPIQSDRVSSGHFLPGYGYCRWVFFVLTLFYSTFVGSQTAGSQVDASLGMSM
jgi:hypothetical protein